VSDDDYKCDNSVLWCYCPNDDISYIPVRHDWLVRGASQRIGTLCGSVATNSASPAATFNPFNCLLFTMSL
jgi:hypothetical protein